MSCPGIISLVFYEFHVPATIPFNGTVAGAVSKPYMNMNMNMSMNMNMNMNMSMNMLVQTDLIVLNIYKSSVICAKYSFKVWKLIYKTQNSNAL
jgi:hypothetical protein